MTAALLIFAEQGFTANLIAGALVLGESALDLAMRILLMRHGAAVGYGEVDRDEDRWLTPEGRGAVRKVAALLREQGLLLDLVLTSPLVRAVQTAELLADILGCEGVKTHIAMAPDRGGVDQALEPARSLEAGQLIALVGHEPKIRALSHRLGGSAAAAGFRAGEARLFSTSPGARLLLSVDPKHGLELV